MKAGLLNQESIDDLLDTVDTQYSEKLSFQFDGPLSLRLDEREAIHREVERFYALEALPEYSVVLIELLSIEFDPREIERLVGHIKSLLARYLTDLNFAHAIELLQPLRQLVDDRPDVGTAYEEMIEALSAPEEMEQLFKRLLYAPTLNRKQFTRTISFLSSRILPQLISVISSISNRTLKEILTAAAGTLASRDPNEIQPYLRESDPERLRTVFEIIEGHPTPDAIAHFNEIINSPSCAFKTDVLRALKNFPLPDTRAIWIRAIENPEEAVRIESVRYLSNFRSPDLWPTVKARVTRRVLEQLGKEERELLLQMVPRIEPKEGFSILSDLAKDRHRFSARGRSRQIDLQISALSALALCQDLRVPERIDQATRSRYAAVRDAARVIQNRMKGILR